MIFKQSDLKELRFSQLIVPFTISFLAYIGVEIWIGLNVENMATETCIILSILLFPVCLFFLIGGIASLEWYHIYNDRIEVRYVFGRKNIVYFDKVLFVEETELALSRAVYKTFYIFHDGRKNNNNFLDITSCANKKKYNLKIYKTDRLEHFIKNELNLTVKKK